MIDQQQDFDRTTSQASKMKKQMQKRGIRVRAYGKKGTM